MVLEKSRQVYHDARGGNFEHVCCTARGGAGRVDAVKKSSRAPFLHNIRSADASPNSS